MKKINTGNKKEHAYETREDVGAITRYIRRKISWGTFRQPLSILLMLIVWHLLTTYEAPLFKQVPKPLEVLNTAISSVPTEAYWIHVLYSNKRVLSGFVIAIATGVSLGLLMGYRTLFQNWTFPCFEVLRPIPPIAWLPISVIMFPTPEMSVTYLVFIGAFFPIVLNTLLGAVTVGENYKRAAMSLGATPKYIFRRIILPGATPSIFVGMMVGAGMTWEMVVAAEMIAGGLGLGYMTWDAYVVIAYPKIILGMISIGICGAILSGVVRLIGNKIMPWRQLF